MPKPKRALTQSLRDELRRAIAVRLLVEVMKLNDMKTADIEKYLSNRFHGVGKGECVIATRISNVVAASLFLSRTGDAISDAD